MFKGLFFDTAMLYWAGIPLVLALAIFLLLVRYWENTVKSKANGIPCSSEAFRGAINSALTVSGFMLPLLCGGIGYLALQLVAPSKLVPLVAITGLLALSIMVGLWNMFSMIGMPSGTITITEDSLTWFVPQLVTQLCFLFFAIIVLLFYLLFSLDLPKTATIASTATASCVTRPQIRLNMKQDDVEKAWGRPSSIDKAPQGDEWRYASPNVDTILLIKDAEVISITERKTP
jgi:hypothetical protein